MEIFNKNLDELDYLGKKENVTRHLRKNYKENFHFIKIKYERKIGQKKNGGQNKITYLLTEKVFELMKNSYNLRNRYIVNISENVRQINPIVMCIENQTIGFIENSYKNIFQIKRQYIISKYRVDLYFIDYKLVIECDEYNHDDRDSIQEKIREDYILSLGNQIIR
jgi:very-short-patch-repair endonuclease